MAFGDDLADLMGRGSAITEHIADTPGLAREMRYSPSNADRQEMQDYLAPLAAQDFAADARRTGDVGGVLAALGSPLYVAAKAVAPELVSRATGTGGALTSAPSFEQVRRAYRGLLTDPTALQREVTAEQVANAAPSDSGFRAGRVSWGDDTPWYLGGAFTPNDVLPAASAALGGLAGAVGAGARAIAPVATRASAAPVANAAEGMFAPAAQAGRTALDIPVGASALGAGHAAAGGLSGPISDLMAWYMRRNGLGMEFPPATQAHPAYRGKERQ